MGAPTFGWTAAGVLGAAPLVGSAIGQQAPASSAGVGVQANSVARPPLKVAQLSHRARQLIPRAQVAAPPFDRPESCYGPHSAS